jgi:hypothetical protein
MRIEHNTRSKKWNRSSCHGPEVVGAINTGFARGMDVAGKSLNNLPFSLTDEQRKSFFMAVANGIRAKVNEILKFMEQNQR